MNKEFQSHKLNEDGLLNSKRITAVFDQILDVLTKPHNIGIGPDVVICPPGRETSLLRTKLEEACFYARKAMASAPENQGT